MNNNGKKPGEMREGREGEQLSPIVTPFSNSILKGPEDTDVVDLACELAIDPEGGFTVTVSAWDLDERQRAWVAAGAHMRMSVWQHPIPPLALAVEAPFCPVCAAPCVYVKSEQAFVCATGDCSNYRRNWLDVTSGVELLLKPGDVAADDQGKTAEEQVREDFSPAPEDTSD